MAFRWGHLQVRGQIGRGSSGTVYRAFDTVLERDVAVKLLEDSPIRARAFIAEARRLAQVRHGNVLAVYGAAVHDGRAGLWSDLIDGLSLDEWIDINGPRPAVEVLDLARSLASALQAVHTAGLVHGDVKPGNILRETGSNRIVLMDFGSAGDHEFAARHGLLGSPASMAPEQQRGGSVGPATDIYGLGVVLFHAASGRYPAAADGDDGSGSANMIRHLPLPRALRRLMREMLALAPESRPAAPAVIERLERIAGAPQRRRRQASWASVLAALAVGLGISLWQADKAREQAEYANHTRDFVVSLLRDTDPSMSAQGAELKVVELLRQSVARVESELGEFPGLQGELRITLAHALLEIGELESALPLAQSGVDQLRAHYGPRSRQLGDGLIALFRIQLRLGNAEQTEALAHEAIAIRDRHASGPDSQRIGIKQGLAWMLNQRGHHQEALEMGNQALAERIELLGEDHPELTAEYNNVGVSAIYAEQYRDAETAFRKSIELQLSDGMEEHPRIATVRTGLAVALMGLGRFDEAEIEFNKALDIATRRMGARSGTVISATNGLGELRRQQGRLPEARVLLTEGAALAASTGMAIHQTTADLRLGLTLLAEGQAAEAMAALTSAESLMAERFPERPQLKLTRVALGLAFALIGQHQAGLELAESALADLQRDGLDGGSLFAEAAYWYAELLAVQGQEQSAREWLLHSESLFLEALGTEHPQTLRVRDKLAGDTRLLISAD
jgi:tetratricopeptide (TPR) repeat protein